MQRYRLRHSLWKVQPPSEMRSEGYWDKPRKCGRVPVSSKVGIKQGGPFGAGVSGVVKCGSVWICPVCSARIRQERAMELEQGLLAHLADGGGLYMLTLTLKHGIGDSLQRSLDVLLGSWRKVQQHRTWRDETKRIGMVGWVRATEITYGANGWHPHLHVLLLTDSVLDEADRVRWEQTTAERWVEVVDRTGLGTPDLIHGCRLQSCTSAEDGAQYVLKEQTATAGGSRRPVMELLRGDLKTPQRKGLAPWDLLTGAATGEKEALILWWEYERVTRGRRCMGWSKGLRAQLRLGAERTDEDIIDEDQGGDVVALIDAVYWRSICRKGQDDEVLAVVEHGGYEALSRWMVARGWPPPDRVEVA